MQIWQFGPQDSPARLAIILLEPVPIDQSAEDKKAEIDIRVQRELALLFLGSGEKKSALLEQAKRRFPELQRSQISGFLSTHFVKGRRKQKEMELAAFLQFGSEEEYRLIMEERTAEVDRQLEQRRLERRERKERQLNQLMTMINTREQHPQ